MTAVSAAVRDVLAAVLVLAAGAKASDLHGFARTLAGLGLGRFSTRTRLRLGVVLVACEGVLGLATAAQVAIGFVNLADLCLMVAFATVTALALARGVTVRCRCFGALSGTSFSAGGMARATVLVVLAAIATVLGEQGLQPSSGTFLVAAAFMLVGIAAAQASTVVEEARLARL